MNTLDLKLNPPTNKRPSAPTLFNIRVGLVVVMNVIMQHSLVAGVQESR